MKKLYIPNVVLTVTESCNLSCMNCRRDINGKSMSDKTMSKIFDEVKYVPYLTISGGDPLIYKNNLKRLLNILKEKQVQVEQFSVTTSGVFYDNEVDELFDEFEQYLNMTPLTYQKFDGSTRAYMDLIDNKDVDHLADSISGHNVYYRTNCKRAQYSKYFGYIRKTTEGLCVYNVGKSLFKNHGIKKAKLYNFADEEYYYVGPVITFLPNGDIYNGESNYGNAGNGVYNLLKNHSKKCDSLDKFYEKTDDEAYRLTYKK